MKILFLGSKPETKVVSLSMRMMNLPNHLKRVGFLLLPQKCFSIETVKAHFSVECFII